jgi:hypothetical protein
MEVGICSETLYERKNPILVLNDLYKQGIIVLGNCTTKNGNQLKKIQYLPVRRDPSFSHHVN